jgi:hypothetical protein
MTLWIRWHEFWGHLEVPAPAGLFPAPEVSRYALEVARVAEAQVGIKEVGGNNLGRDIDMYRTDRQGRMGPGGAWCAALVSWDLEEAAENLGQPCPVKRSHNAKKLFLNASKVGMNVERPSRGCLALWHRGIDGARTGHIAVVTQATRLPKFTCVEGNKGPFPAPVDYFDHVLGEHNLLGFVRLP